MTTTRRAGQALVTATVLLVTACGSGGIAATGTPSAPGTATAVAKGALPTEPASSGAVREVFPVDSLQALTEQSDLVVVGRATAVAAGRDAGSDVGGHLGFRDVTVEIERVLHGTYDQPTLILEELGWKDGEPFTVNQAAWATTGDTMLMGVRATLDGRASTEPRYVLTSSSARFFLAADGEVSDNFRAGHGQQEANAFVRESAALTADELVRRVEDAG